MNKSLCLSAVLALTTISTATAGGEGRTVCVLRSRPVAIQPAARPVITYGANVMSPTFRPSPTISGVGPFGTHYNNWAYRVPVVYGNYIQRYHFVNPCLPNGYVGGLRNLPSNYVNIPPVFTRAPMRYSPGPGRPGGGHGSPGGGNGHPGGGSGHGGGRGK